MKDPLETTESVLPGFAEEETKEELRSNEANATFMARFPNLSFEHISRTYDLAMQGSSPLCEADDPDDPASEFPDPPIVDVEDGLDESDIDDDEEFDDDEGEDDD